MNRRSAALPPSTNGLVPIAGNPSRDTITAGIAAMHTSKRHTGNAAGRGDRDYARVTYVQTVT